MKKLPIQTITIDIDELLPHLTPLNAKIRLALPEHWKDEDDLPRAYLLDVTSDSYDIGRFVLEVNDYVGSVQSCIQYTARDILRMVWIAGGTKQHANKIIEDINVFATPITYASDQ